MRFAGILGAASIVLLSSSLAWAGGDESLSPADRTELEAVIKDALAHARKGEYEAARVGYQKAYDRFPTTIVLFNLALAELRSGHELDALHHLDAYVVMADADKARLDLIKNELRPKAYAATGHVLIDGAAPAGARISVDGRELADGDARMVDVTPGDHEVIARTKESTWRAHVDAVAGQNTTVSFELVARATPAPAPRPAVTASTSSPPPPERDHGAQAGFWNARRVTTATILGGAVLAAGAGLVFGLESSSDASHASDVRNQLGANTSCNPTNIGAHQALCTDLHDTLDQQNTFSHLSTGFWVGAGVLAVGGAVTYALWPSQADSKRGAIVPIVDPASKMGGVVGRFEF